MINIFAVHVDGFEPALRGMRNPMNSWAKSDSGYWCSKCKDNCQFCGYNGYEKSQYVIGPNDRDLATRLILAGSDHRKFLRQIIVWCDIEAPLFWWKEFDTYKVGTVANSCSTMHTLTWNHLERTDFAAGALSEQLLSEIIDELNHRIDEWKSETDRDKKEEIWREIIEMLPSSYMQTRTVMMSYEVLRNIFFARRSHKLREWKEFCVWIKRSLPHSWMITVEKEEKSDERNDKV